MLVNFYLTKRFFLYDIIVGESVISHGIGRINIPAKWCNYSKASCRSKQQQKVITRSHSHSNRLTAQRSKYVHMPRSMGNSYTEYPPPQWLKYHRYFHQNHYAHRRNLYRTLKDPIVSGTAYLYFLTSVATQKWWVFPHHNRFRNTMGSCRILHNVHMFCFIHQAENH